MIRYPIEEHDLRDRIHAAKDSWFQRAAERTEELRGLGRYQESSSIWGEIKPVYMDVQGEKCAYCERKLEGDPFGSIEHDLEHFRPKGPVKRWPTEALRDEWELEYDFELGDVWDEGYYLLAYDILNYASACKPCNSRLKSNYFPIFGDERGPQTDDCRTLAAEKPLLIYPLDGIDDDPEELITFQGLVAVPKHADGYARFRAIVTIDFFQLNGRETLRRERALHLYLLWDLLDKHRRATGPAERAELEGDIAGLLDPRLPHTACKRAFQELYQLDRALADDIGAAAKDYYFH